MAWSHLKSEPAVNFKWRRSTPKVDRQQPTSVGTCIGDEHACVAALAVRCALQDCRLIICYDDREPFAEVRVEGWEHISLGLQTQDPSMILEGFRNELR